MPSWAIWVRTWRRTATSILFSTVTAPVARFWYVTMPMPSRSSLRTAEWIARSGSDAPALTRVTASMDALRKARLAPSTIWMLSLASIRATPWTVALTWRGHAGAPPQRATSSASEASRYLSAVASTAASISARCSSRIAISSAVCDCASRFSATMSACPSPPPDSSAAARRSSILASISPYTAATASPATSICSGESISSRGRSRGPGRARRPPPPPRRSRSSRSGISS